MNLKDSMLMVLKPSTTFHSRKKLLKTVVSKLIERLDKWQQILLLYQCNNPNSIRIDKSKISLDKYVVIVIRFSGIYVDAEHLKLITLPGFKIIYLDKVGNLLNNELLKFKGKGIIINNSNSSNIIEDNDIGKMSPRLREIISGRLKFTKGGRMVKNLIISSPFNYINIIENLLENFGLSNMIQNQKQSITLEYDNDKDPRKYIYYQACYKYSDVKKLLYLCYESYLSGEWNGNMLLIRCIDKDILTLLMKLIKFRSKFNDESMEVIKDSDLKTGMIDIIKNIVIITKPYIPEDIVTSDDINTGNSSLCKIITVDNNDFIRSIMDS